MLMRCWRPRAFARPTAVETLSAIVRDDPMPLDQRTPGIPPPVRWIVERCLAKAPADRYGTTRDLARDLATARDRYTELMAAGPALAAPKRLRVREVVAWGLAGAAAIAALLLFAQTGRAPASDDSRRTVRFALAAPEGTVFENAVGAPPFALSPDGRQIAFVAARVKGLRTLFLQSLDAVAPREIAGTEGARAPFWSADGKSVGFFADKSLNRLDVGSGGIATVCPAPQGGGATWNQDGVILFTHSVDGALPACLRPAARRSPSPPWTRPATRALTSLPCSCPMDTGSCSGSSAARRLVFTWARSTRRASRVSRLIFQPDWESPRRTGCS
jgi:hypothetical protein